MTARALPNGYNASPWTPEREAKAKALWVRGDSASQIARAIAEPGWRPSRNSVIGAAHRRGWDKAFRAKPCAPKLRAPVMAKPKQGPRPKIARVTVSALTGLPGGPRSKPVRPSARGPIPLLCEPVGLLDLTPGACRYPVSGEGEHTLFCGFEAASTYCTAHRAICWTGTPERKTPTTPLPKGMAA